MEKIGLIIQIIKYIDLDYNYKTVVHKKKYKKVFFAEPKKLNWLSKPWNQIPESIVNSHKHFTKCLINNIKPDTDGEDNIKSFTKVFAHTIPIY